MMQKDQFLSLTGKIVMDVFPSESAAFTVASPQIAEDLFKNRDVGAEREHRPGEFQFLEEATHVLQFVGLMIGTFTAIQRVIKTLKEDKKHIPAGDLAPIWIKELRQSGLPEKTAVEVVNRFSKELEGELSHE